MKYKVIGWTYYENYDIPFSNGGIGFAERNAVIDEIRKHKYMFTGWHHQESWNNCVPILNDGKKRGFSQRGWGGVMAEAYGEMGDFDYASYAFFGGGDDSNLRYPNNEFEIEDFVSEPLENEHFDVEVSEGLFEIAKKKNPFYLEDLDSLRFIDANDTITLRCNDETLTFLVADVNRDKKEIKFSKHHLIEGKYKIIITHKPMRKVYTRKPLMIVHSDIKNVFNECLKKYDFNKLIELFDSYNIEDVTNNSKSKKVLNVLKQFVSEYTDYAFNGSIVNRLLYFINEYEFTKEIAYKVLDFNQYIFVSFINYFSNKGLNVDEDIKTLLKIYKGEDKYIETILLKAIELYPDNKSLRRRYYKVTKFSNNKGFILYMGIGETKSLISTHKRLIELDDFNSLGTMTILRIVELMSYPTYDVSNDENYCYNAPEYFNTPYKCIKEGVLKYQEYVNEKYDLSNRLEELLTVGVNKICTEYEQYLDEERTAAKEIYALDALSGFRFDLKNKAIKVYPHLKKYILDRYQK